MFVLPILCQPLGVGSITVFHIYTHTLGYVSVLLSSSVVGDGAFGAVVEPNPNLENEYNLHLIRAASPPISNDGVHTMWLCVSVVNTLW